MRVLDGVESPRSLTLDSVAASAESTWPDDGLLTKAGRFSAQGIRYRVSCCGRRRDAQTPLAELAPTLEDAIARRPIAAFFKRLLDVSAAFTALLLLSPILLMVAIAIRLTSDGPVFFSQLRHGLNGEPFRIYKFRTFYADLSDETGVAHTVANDPRVTPLGRLLRRTNIDELPQLWNVVTGDMSLVGPRPHAIGMKAVGVPYEDLVPGYRLRLLVKPGLTGLAQSRGFRGEITNPFEARGRVVLDLIYIARFGFFQDIRILVNTVLSEFRGGSGI